MKQREPVFFVTVRFRGKFTARRCSTEVFIFARTCVFCTVQINIYPHRIRGAHFTILRISSFFGGEKYIFIYYGPPSSGWKQRVNISKIRCKIEQLKEE